MNVLVITALPPERASFVGRIIPLARALHRADHHVEILTLSGATRPPFTETFTDTRGFAISVVGPNIRPTAVTTPTIGSAWRRYHIGHRALAGALSERRADVIVLEKPQPQNTGPALSFARARDVPILLDADDFEPAASRFPFPVRWAMRTLDCRAARAAAVITACSPFLVAHYRRLNPRTRVELLPTGIDLPSNIPPAHLRARLKLPQDVSIVLYVGSLSLSSGHRVDLLLNAWSRLRLDQRGNAHLVISGNGIDAERLRARVARDAALKSRVHFIGRFTPPEDIALAREADLLVDPVDQSLTAEAKSSHRTMLALATGTPIVTGAVGVRLVLLPPALHSLCLYDPARRDDLTTALAHGLAPSAKAAFQRGTRGMFNQWSWDTLGKRFVALLESLHHLEKPLISQGQHSLLP